MKNSSSRLMAFMVTVITIFVAALIVVGQLDESPQTEHPIEQTEKLLASVARNTSRPDEYDGLISEKCWTWLKEAMRGHQNTYTLNVRGSDEVTVDILFAEDTNITLRYVDKKLRACEKNG